MQQYTLQKNIQKVLVKDNMKKILVSDPTLRDGNHAIFHQLTKSNISFYCKGAEASGIPIVEVGHGNGIGASSLQVGESIESDSSLLETARNNLKNTKLGVHIIPGFATIKKDILNAISIGVDVFRVASHCTEADITKRHIEFLKERNKETYGVLMMSHMASSEKLLEESLKMESYGAEGIIIMDSAGFYLPTDVKERVLKLKSALNKNTKVGFHGHNNLGLAIANSIVAVENGAEIIDGTIKGFGAGAGNTQLEVLVGVLAKIGYETGINFKELIKLTQKSSSFIISQPVITELSLVSGLSGVFSGFLKHVINASEKYEINPIDLFYKIGEKKLVAGQEDLIFEIALELSKLTKGV